ncbi:MAG: hypothetical protein U9O96_03090 [Candidatus Thermoplasmatota archaeon]|nr:hypothetical protein [Candidatus Thermoplasmatota archaeon]
MHREAVSDKAKEEFEWHGNEHQNAHGISMYFPPEGNYVSSYENTDFALHTHWDEFLQTLYNM